MEFICGDPYRYPPCTGCPRCRGAQPAPEDQEPANYVFPEYDPDPEESEPSEAESEPSEQESDPEEGSESHGSDHDYDAMETSEEDVTVEVSSEEEAMDLEESEGESDGNSEEDDDDDLPHAADSGSEATIDGPLVERTRVIIRRRDEPLPPPSHQIYRHPGGVRWMHTPRKRVPAIRSGDAFRAPMPAPDVPSPPRRPQWVTHLRDWSCEARLPPPMGLGHQEFVIGDENMADRSLPVIVGRIA